MKYILRRLQRMRGSPHALASGFACGAAVSFLPLPGLHFIMGGLLAVAMRGSIIASAIGTIIGNPWTFPLIWISSFRFGHLLGFGEKGDITEGSLSKILKGVADDVWRGNFLEAALDSLPVFEPMFVGGSIMGVIVWLAFYFSLRRIIRTYQRKRQERIDANRAARAARLRTVGEG